MATHSESTKWVRDLRAALQHVRRSPGFSAIGILTLTIGVGITAAMFALMDALLLRPPAHVTEPADVVRLRFRLQNSTDIAVVERTHYANILDLRMSGAFESIAAYASLSVSIGAGSDATLANAMLVSKDFFDVLRPTPSLAALSQTWMDGNEAGQSVVISQGLFYRHFAGDGPTGQRLTVDGRSYVVSGVAPRGFQALSPKPIDVWLPLDHPAAAGFRPLNWRHNRGPYWLSVVARLRDGVEEHVAIARADGALEHRGPQVESDTSTSILTTSIVPGRGTDESLESRVSLWLSGVSALVLLIACANVSNLVLMRAVTRRRESFIRRSLGATRRDLARRACADMILLVLPASLGALLVSYLLRNSIVGFLSGGVPLSRDFWDARTALIVIASGAVALGMLTVVSLWQHRSAAGAEGLFAEAKRSDVGKNARQALLGLQAAVCLVLLFLAVLFATSLRRVEGLDLGVDLHRTIQLTLSAPPTTQNDDRRVTMIERALDALRSQPGVERIALAQGSPYTSGSGIGPRTSDRTFQELWANKSEVAYRSLVGAGFFSAVGAHSLRGRDFSEEDVGGAPRVAIINAPLATYLWPSKDPLGECIWVEKEGDCVQVIGVLGGVWKFSALKRDRMAVYLPLAQVPDAVPTTLFIRTESDAARIVPQLRAVVQSLEPDLPAVRIAPLRDALDPEVRPWRLGATIFLAFAAVALIVTAIGLYSIVAVTTALRTREIGIRIALGAQRSHVVRLVVSEGIRAVTVGFFLGGAIVMLSAGQLGTVLFETSPHDSTVLAQTAFLLLAVSVAAILVPVLRALRTSPARVLQAQP